MRRCAAGSSAGWSSCPGHADRPARRARLGPHLRGTRTINGRDGDLDVPARAGRHRPGPRGEHRQRTDGALGRRPYRVLAVDGTDVHGPAVVERSGPAAHRRRPPDLEITVPAAGSASAPAEPGHRRGRRRRATRVPCRSQPTANLDLLTYGTPTPIGFDPADRDPALRLPDRPSTRLREGPPGMFWSINGHLYPNVPMYVVR